MGKNNDENRIADKRGGNAVTAIGSVMLITLVSKVFGILRESVQAGVFGAADAYYAGYNKTIYLFTTAAYALCIAAVPIITKEMTVSRKNGEKTANNLATFSLLISLGALVLWEVFTLPKLSPVIFGASGGEISGYIRIMALSLPIIVMAYMMVAVFQSMEHFTLQGTMALPYSIFMIGYLLLLGNKLSLTAYVIAGTASWVLQLAMSLPYALKEKYTFRPTLDLKQRYIRSFLKTAAVTVVTTSMYLFCYLIDASKAESLGDGVTSAFYYADKLFTPLTTTFIYSISAVVFPKFNREYTKTDRSEYMAYVWSVISNTLVIVFPVCAMLIVFGGDVLKVLFESGSFTPSDTAVTAKIFTMYALGMAGFSVIDLVNKSFFTMNRSLTPLLITLGVVGADLIMNTVFGASGEFVALATAVAMTVGAAASLNVMFHGEKAVSLSEPIKSLIASVIIGAMSFALRSILVNGTERKLLLVLKCGAIGVLAMTVFAVLCYVFKLGAITDFVKRLKNRGKAE